MADQYTTPWRQDSVPLPATRCHHRPGAILLYNISEFSNFFLCSTFEDDVLHTLDTFEHNILPLEDPFGVRKLVKRNREIVNVGRETEPDRRELARRSQPLTAY